VAKKGLVVGAVYQCRNKGVSFTLKWWKF